MQFFPLLDFQDIVLAFFLGAGFVLLVYLAFSSYQQEREELSKDDLEKLDGGDLAKVHDPEARRIAPVLIFIYIGVIVWAVSYVIVVGIKGGAF
jgi:hypothetical protein